MKNLIVIALATFLGTSVPVSGSNGENETNNSKTKISKSGSIGIGVDIQVGRRTKDCTGWGICGVKIRVETDPTAFIKYDGGEGTLMLTISEDYVRQTQPDKLKYFAGQRQFVMEEDFVLPSDVCAKIGAKSNTTIKAGRYPMTLRDKIYTIMIGDQL